MRVMICREDGTVGQEHDIERGQGFALVVQRDGVAIAWRVAKAEHLRVGAPLDPLDRLMVVWGVLLCAGQLVYLASSADHWLGSVVLLLAAAAWGSLIRKAWRATR